MSGILEENPWSTPELSITRTANAANHDIQSGPPATLVTDQIDIYTSGEPENEFIDKTPVGKMTSLDDSVKSSINEPIIPTSDPAIVGSDPWSDNTISHDEQSIGLEDNIWDDVPPLQNIDSEKVKSLQTNTPTKIESSDNNKHKITKKEQKVQQPLDSESKPEITLPINIPQENSIDDLSNKENSTHADKLDKVNENMIHEQSDENNIKFDETQDDDNDNDNYNSDDDDNDDDDDFGSFESVEEKKIFPLEFFEPVDKILASLIPQASNPFNPPSKSTGINMLLAKPEISAKYDLLTSKQRQYKSTELPKSQFRSRSYLDKSPINQELINISKHWSKAEKGVYVSEKDQYNKNMSRLNVFQWSTVSSAETANKSKKEKNSVTRDMKPQVNQRLLKVAFNETKKILEKRKDEQAQVKLKLERERRERELRLSQEKRKKEEEIKNRYSSPLTSTTTSKKKTFFGSLFGSNKSKIAKDSVSHTQIKPSEEPHKSLSYHDEEDFMSQLNLPTVTNSNEDAEDNLEFGDFEGSDDEALGYNQLGSELPTEIDHSKKELDGNEDEDSFGEFLQTPDTTNGRERVLSSLYFEPIQTPIHDSSVTGTKENTDSNSINNTTGKSSNHHLTNKQEPIEEVKHDNDESEISNNKESDDESFADFDSASVVELPTLGKQDSILFDVSTSGKDSTIRSDTNSNEPHKKTIVAQHKRTATPIKINSPSLDQYIPKSAALVDRTIDDSNIQPDSDDDDDFSDFVTSPEPEEMPPFSNKSSSLIRKLTHTGSSLQISSSNSPSPISNNSPSPVYPSTTRSFSPVTTPHPLRHLSKGFSETMNQSPHTTSNKAAPIKGSPPMMLTNLRRKHSVQRKQYIPNPDEEVDIPQSLVPDLSSDISNFYQNTIMNNDVLVRSGSVSRKSSMSRKSSVKRTGPPKPPQNLIDL